MPEITILCPVHNKEEKINIPDTYKGSAVQGSTFEGDIPCSGATGQNPHARLHVKIFFPHSGNPSVEELHIH